MPPHVRNARINTRGGQITPLERNKNRPPLLAWQF
jgi:hypothetical protein